VVEEEEKSRSGDWKDGKINREGKKLEVVEVKGWSIFNGNMKGMKKGNSHLQEV